LRTLGNPLEVWTLPGDCHRAAGCRVTARRGGWLQPAVPPRLRRSSPGYGAMFPL
jgi:hypothetical protein